MGFEDHTRHDRRHYGVEPISFLALMPLLWLWQTVERFLVLHKSGEHVEGEIQEVLDEIDRRPHGW